MSTVIVRLIKSFEYRNVKNMIFLNLDLSSVTTEQLLEMINERIQKEDQFIHHRNKKYDTLKIHYKAHGAKTQNLVVRLDDDEGLILRNGVTLKKSGVEHETEISCFNAEEYINYKKNPQIKW